MPTALWPFFFFFCHSTLMELLSYSTTIWVTPIHVCEWLPIWLYPGNRCGSSIPTFHDYHIRKIDCGCLHPEYQNKLQSPARIWRSNFISELARLDPLLHPHPALHRGPEAYHSSTPLTWCWTHRSLSTAVRRVLCWSSRFAEEGKYSSPFPTAPPPYWSTAGKGGYCLFHGSPDP